MIPIEGHSNLVRDEITGAVLNNDDYGYKQYIKMKESKDSQKEELDRIKSDIDEIKTLLKQLVNPT